jgi:hypothetical protein
MCGIVARIEQKQSVPGVFFLTVFGHESRFICSGKAPAQLLRKEFLNFRMGKNRPY